MKNKIILAMLFCNVPALGLALVRLEADPWLFLNLLGSVVFGAYAKKVLDT